MSKLIPQQICPQQLWVAGEICTKTLRKDTDTETADLPSLTFTSFDLRDPKIFGNLGCFPDFRIIPRSGLDTRLQGKVGY